MEVGEWCYEEVLLPSEVWEQVFGWLDSVRDLCACTATCRAWAALCWRQRRHVRLHALRPQPAASTDHSAPYRPKALPPPPQPLSS
jgi:hypothetical protein